MLGIGAIVKRGHEALLAVTARPLSEVGCEEVFHKGIAVLLGEAVHVVLYELCSQMIVAVGWKQSCYIKRGPRRFPLILPEPLL